jgi:methyl-accepting chemotaxis protein
MAETRRGGISLLTKLTIGMLIPLIISFIVFGVIGYFSILKIKTIAIKEGVRSLNDLGEKIIKQKALDVAKQIGIFIKSHPHFTKEELYGLPALKAVAVQKVGITGYTTVHDNKAINRFHKDPKVVGMDLLMLAKKLPEPKYRSILESSLKGRAGGGYYDWKDADGVIRSKYMFCTPIEGTDLVVASTTYIDEFSRPAERRIEQQIMDKADNIKIQFILVVGVIIIMFVFLTSMYSRTIVKPIVYVTDVADRISLGDLDTKIEIRSSDEVGKLAESFDRMQESLKAAIERLRKKRSSG